MAQGKGFLDYAEKSLLMKALTDLGFSHTSEVTEEEKDFGEGAVAYFDVGHLYFTMNRKEPEGFHTDDAFGSERDIVIYHSRFSSNWFFEVRGKRDEAWGHDLEDMNKPNIVAQLVEFTKQNLGLI